MAGGKMSARQKMINLMYLVFIAMLAMNMSKEVLSAFGFMTEKLSENNTTTTQKNNLAYANLATKAKDQAKKFAPLNEKALKVKALSADLFSYLEDIKTKMTADLEDKKAYQSMDKTDFLDNLFFKGDKYSKEGDEFLAKINNYKTGIKSALGNGFDKLSANVDRRFDTSDKTDKDGKKIPWLKYNYEGFPMVASLANFTQMQADIKNTESDILTSLLGGQLEADSKITTNNYQGIVRLDKSAYFAGERVKGQVVLGKYDDAMVPSKVTLNGADATKSVVNGQVVIDIPAGNIGSKTIKGTITFKQDGKDANIPFESTYEVIAQPDEAVISATKMNVVYRGLQNPVAVSLPGVGDKDIKVSFVGATSKKTGTGKYMLSPGKANNVTVNVSAKLSSGKTVNSKKVFRVKDIPPAVMMVNGKSGNIRLPRVALKSAKISAGLPDFMFDLNLKTISFDIKIPGQFAITVQGNKLNAKAIKALNKAKRGDMLTIFNVQASVVGSSYKLKKVYGASIELIN